MSADVESWTAWINDPLPEEITGEDAVNESNSHSCSTSSDLARPDAARKRIQNRAGKIVKRKTRASKRIPTTYINTDPANFRALVQQATGFGFGPMVQPDPLQRPFRHQQQSWLPTADTSDYAVGPGYDFESFPTLESWGVM